MGRPGGSRTEVFPEEGDRLTAPALRPPVLLLLAAVGMLVATGFYNNAAAPAFAYKHLADVVPLKEGSSAAPTARIELTSASAIVTSHFVLDPESKQRYPIAGGPAEPFVGIEIGEAVADGDDIAWISRGTTTSLNLFDHNRGTVRFVGIPPSFAPVNGTLRAGLGSVAWSYARGDGTLAVAFVAAGNSTVRTYGSPIAENRSVVAVLGPDIFYTKSAEASDLWIYNASRDREELIAKAPGVGRTATGVFFVAWVNETSGQVQYFDAIVRSVQHIAPPSEVTLTWVMANDLTILMGGSRPGFLGPSPRVEFYDFGLGVAHIYDSIGVDFEANPHFAYADRTVISLVEERQPRPIAPLTAPLIVVAAAALGLGGLLSLRDTMRADDDL